MSTAVFGNNTGNDFSGTESCCVIENLATNNYHSTLLCGMRANDTGFYNTWIRFTELDNQLSGSTVSAVTLIFTQYDWNSAAGTISVHRCLQNWVYTQTTYNIYSTGNNWATAGGFSNSFDRNDTQATEWTVATGGGVRTFPTGAQFVADVQGIIDGTYTNNGWVLFSDDAGASINWVKFRNEDETDGVRPYLTVTYTAGGGGDTLGWLMDGQSNRPLPHHLDKGVFVGY